MKLFSILFEIAVPDAEYGYWILKTGQMLPVNDYQGHEGVAANYLAYATGYQFQDDEDEWTLVALKKGMVRVISDFKHIEVEWGYTKKPTARQITSIKGIIKAYENPTLKSIRLNNSKQFVSVNDAYSYLNSL